jgi:microcin C transport system permease protein
MFSYIIRRLLFLIPTFLGVTVISFGIFQLAPGGPIESYMAQMRFAGGTGGGASDSGAGAGGTGMSESRGSSSSASAEVIEELKKKYGFDKPIHERYFIWLKNVVTLDFGYSYTYGKKVSELIASKLPVSIRFGLASFILAYLICIPLGIFKALRDGSSFDLATSFTVFVMYSAPTYMLGIILIFFFAGGSHWDLFPLGGIESLDAEKLSLYERIKDQLWHMVLPLICFTIAGFARMTILMKNSLLEEIGKDYVRTARAKGLSEKVVIGKHALRNSLIPLATDFGELVTVFFASNLLIEQIFSLDGFGKLFYDAALSRDYPLLMGSVFIGAGLGLIARLISDVTYVLVDPRINFD